MKNILESWKNSHELIDVRLKRRNRICQALSISGSIFLLVFGLLAVIEQRYIIGVILLASMTAALVNVLILQRKNNLEQAIIVVNVIVAVLILTLLYSGGTNNTGILWIYPLLAISLFINLFWRAVTLSVIYLTLFSLFSLTPLSQLLLAEYAPDVALRFVLTSIALAASCLVALRSEEYAFKLISQLHSNDIHRIAFTDTLTGLPNRWTFHQNLAESLEQRKDKHFLALLYIDLDNFKLVNDNYGHHVGDNFLRHFGKQLKECIRGVGVNKSSGKRLSDDVARLSGDEFVIILNELTSPQEAEIVANRIFDLFAEGYEVDGHIHPVFASVGIAVCSDYDTTAEQLLHYADAAMYQAKSNGNNKLQFFNNDIQNLLIERTKLEIGLKRAVEQRAFSLKYQPIFCIKTKQISALEVLLRCHQAEIEEYGPDTFIPVAEATGLIQDIDEWVLNRAMEEFKLIRQEANFKGKLSINISGIELLDEMFPQKVANIASQHQLPYSLFDIEVTETALVLNNTTAIKILNALSEQGFSISLDDFGTGYTSFNQLILYPATHLKIDRSFIDGLFPAKQSRGHIVQTIHDLAKVYKLKVIAEGVETQEQFDYLHDLGCDYIQGYFLSKPLEQSGIIEFLKSEENNK